METSSCSYLPRRVHQPRGSQPWCPDCDTDLHLVVDSVVVLDARQSTVAAAFGCARCRGSRVLATTAEFLAAVLARAHAQEAVDHGLTVAARP